MIERECPICGAIYQADSSRLRWSRQTTCSRACSYRLRGRKLDRKECFTCATCGNEIKRRPGSVRGKYGSQFCSPACHYAGRAIGATRRVVIRPYVVSDSARAACRMGAIKTAKTRRERDNYRKSEETRAKLSIATSRALARGRPYSISKLEDKVAVELDRLSLSYIRQYSFRDARGRFACNCDFYFLALNAVLEVNGTYWHADPRVYTAPINAMQERCISQYRRKLELLAALGVHVVEVWEEDLKRDIAQTMLVAHSQLIGC